MQVKHKKPTPEFQPIELTITIESAEELKSMYGALNCSNKEMRDNTKSISSEIDCGNNYTQHLFDVLFDIASERGYIK